MEESVMNRHFGEMPFVPYRSSKNGEDPANCNVEENPPSSPFYRPSSYKMKKDEAAKDSSDHVWSSTNEKCIRYAREPRQVQTQVSLIQDNEEQPPLYCVAKNGKEASRPSTKLAFTTTFQNTSRTRKLKPAQAQVSVVQEKEEPLNVPQPSFDEDFQSLPRREEGSRRLQKFDTSDETTSVDGHVVLQEPEEVSARISFVAFLSSRFGRKKKTRPKASAARPQEEENLNSTGRQGMEAGSTFLGGKPQRLRPNKRQQEQQPDENGQRRASQHFPPVRPGAIAVRGVDYEEEADIGTIVIGGDTVINAASPPSGTDLSPLPASLVRSPPRRSRRPARFEYATVISSRNKTRNLVFCLILVILAVVGVALGVWLSQFWTSSSDNVVDSTPNTASPTASPILKQWVMVGEPIGGVLEEELFGFSVAISGDGERIAAGTYVFAAYPYLRTYSVNENSTVTPLGNAILKPLLTNGFGWGISLTQDGAILSTGAQDHAFVYRLVNNSLWEEYGPGPTGYSFTTEISADGSTLVVSDAQGHVLAYRYSSLRQEWLESGQLLTSDVADDCFGCAIALSANGERLAVGITASNAHGDSTGSVRVYDFNGTHWVPQTTEDFVGAGEYDGFGYAVSLSDDGNCVAMGAVQNLDVFGEQNINTTRPGYVQIYCLGANGEWTRRGETLAGQSGSWFGFSVDLSGDGRTVVVGAPLADSRTGIEYAGHVKIFRYEDEGDRWIPMATFEGVQESLSGRSVAISSRGDVVVAGYPWEDAEGGLWRAGVIRVFREVSCDEEDFSPENLAPCRQAIG